MLPVLASFLWNTVNFLMTPSEKLLFFPKLCQTEIPYVVVKFAVFGVAEDLLVQALVGQDDLLISALSGSIAGVAGALQS